MKWQRFTDKINCAIPLAEFSAHFIYQLWNTGQEARNKLDRLW
jgi:hypothetical protein